MLSLRRNLFVAPAIVALSITGGAVAHAYTITGHAQCIATASPLAGAVVKLYEVDPIPGGSYSAELLASAAIGLAGNFTATAAWPPAGAGFEAGDPDIIVEIHQNIGGSVEVIYQELNSEARWNLADGSSIALELASPQAVCVATSGGPPNDRLFLFTRVGSYETANIDCKGSLASSEGYLLPRKAGTWGSGFTGARSDQPVGRTLDLFAWLGKKANVAYYKLQHCFDEVDDCTVEANWTDVETPLPNKWYDTSDANSLHWHWVPRSMGPFEVDGIENLYQIPYLVLPNTPWSWLDRAGRFNTTAVPDGLNRLRIVPYKIESGSLVAATSSDLKIHSNHGEIVLQVDNTPPVVEILDLKLNGTSKEACEVLTLGKTDKVTVEYRVRDPRGHLLDYTLDATYGHDCHVRPFPSVPDPAVDNYANNASASPSWLGQLSYSTDYPGSVYVAGVACSGSGDTPCIDCSNGNNPSNQMPSCAYQFQLQASKRTTNGYGLIYRGIEDTWHVTIQRQGETR